MRLPEALTRCRVPPAFSPSQLAFGDECLLRAVLGSIRAVPALTAHPAAALGSVFHKLVEMAARGAVPRMGTPNEDANRTLDRLLDEEDARLSASCPTDAPKLRELFPPLTWRRKRRTVLDLVDKYLSGAVPIAPANLGGRRRRAEDLPKNGSWAEVQIEAPSLRLRGQADQIQRKTGAIVIRDLKTGRVLTNDGDVMPHIERQMRLYGTMARIVWPLDRISLIVDDSVEREVEFSPEHEANVLDWLRTVLDRLPPDIEVETESLAIVGRGCEGCAHRHVCPAYRQKAPDIWRGESPVRMPLDIWGEVMVVSAHQGFADFTIRDAAGRTVKVFGVTTVRASDFRPGDPIWLFSLRTRDKRGGADTWRHPHNFFEVADDDRFARAWSLQSFTGGSTD